MTKPGKRQNSTTSNEGQNKPIDLISYRNNLGRANNKQPYQYRFVFQTKLYKGTTDCYDLESAKRWLLKYKSELSLNRIDLKADASRNRISDVLREWVKNAKALRMSPSYIKHVEQRVKDHVLPVLGDKLMRELTSGDMKSIVTAYLSGKRPGRWSHIKRTESGANALLMHLSGLITFAEERDYLTKKPKLPFLKAQAREKKIIPEKSLPQFLKNVDEENEPHFSLIVRFCLLHGLRESEARSMRWHQVDLEAHSFKLEKQKNKEFSGNLKLAGSMIPLLSKLKAKAEESKVRSLYLFPSESKGGFRSRNYLVVLLNKASIRTLGHKLSTHALRRTFITSLSTSGVSLFTIMDLARHKSITTTQRYVVTQDRAQEEAIDVMDRLAGA